MDGTWDALSLQNLKCDFNCPGHCWARISLTHPVSHHLMSKALLKRDTAYFQVSPFARQCLIGAFGRPPTVTVLWPERQSTSCNRLFLSDFESSPKGSTYLPSKLKSIWWTAKPNRLTSSAFEIQNAFEPWHHWPQDRQAAKTQRMLKQF